MNVFQPKLRSEKFDDDDDDDNNNNNNNNNTYLLTPWSRVLLEKLASLQLVKKFPALIIIIMINVNFSLSTP